MSRNDLLATGTIELCTECPLLAHQRHTGVVVGVWFALQSGSLKTLPRIIHGREQECLPSAALSLYPEGPKVPIRRSSLRPCEPAIRPQQAPILELLRWSAALSDPLRVVQVGAVVIALDFLPLGTWARASTILCPLPDSPMNVRSSTHLIRAFIDASRQRRSPERDQQYQTHHWRVWQKTGIVERL